MNDIRRSILWAVFIFSIFMLYESWNRHTGQPGLFYTPPAVSAPAVASGASNPGAVAGKDAASVAAGASAVATAGGTANTAEGGGVAPAFVKERIDFTTDVYKATFDTEGASLVKLELLKQVDQADRTKPVVLFDLHDQHIYTAQTGLLGAAGLPNHLSGFKLVSTDKALPAQQDQLVVRFESEPQGGVKLAKIFTFKRGSYLIDVKHELTNTGTTPIKSQVYLQLVRDGQVFGNTNMFAGPVSYTGAAFYTNESKFKKVSFEDIDKGKSDYLKNANDGWVSVIQHYFASAWIKNDSMPREFFTRKLDNNRYAVGMVFTLNELAPGASTSLDSQLFAGPQEEKKLEAMAPGLELVKDYGIFTLLAKPLFWLLDKIHSVVGNWGWAIVLLVVLLKAAFYSLNASAYRSMAKMKAVNPRITEMRERLKDNPQQMQQEMMKIYREEKVNPVGGCLPMLVQIPVFISLYWVLLSSVEMRNAPWIGWIHDLSVPDPYYILPLLMTVSTVIQTKLNPAPPDPMQAKMMMIMPLLFSVMFFFFPAGLVLYWVTNNILTIAQQYFINKQIEKKAAASST